MIIDNIVSAAVSCLCTIFIFYVIIKGRDEGGLR